MGQVRPKGGLSAAVPHEAVLRPSKLGNLVLRSSQRSQEPSLRAFSHRSGKGSFYRYRKVHHRGVGGVHLARSHHHLDLDQDLYFLKVRPSDPLEESFVSTFYTVRVLKVRVRVRVGVPVVRVRVMRFLVSPFFSFFLGRFWFRTRNGGGALTQYARLYSQESLP